MRDYGMEYRVDSEGLTVYKRIDDVISMKVVPIPSYFRITNKEFLVSKDGECLYINDNIYLKLGDNFILPNGNKVSLNSKEEITAELNRMPTDKAGIVCYNGKNEFVLTRPSFKQVVHFLTDDLNFKPLIDIILTYIESEFMCEEHPESNIVIGDALGISNNVILADNISVGYDSFREFFKAQYHYVSGEVLADIDNVYSSLKFILRKAIAGPDADATSLRSSINIPTNNSVMLKYESNRIRIIEFSSPSARRYKLNCKYKEEEEDE